MEIQGLDFNSLLEKYTPLINKLAYQFYNQYSSFIDFNDAKQEMLLCFYRCVLNYDSNKSSFGWYYIVAANRHKSRFYYSHFNSILLSQRKVYITSFFEKKFANNTSISIRDKLSDCSSKLLEIYYHHGKLTIASIAKTFQTSKYYAKKMFEQFKNELLSAI